MLTAVDVTLVASDSEGLPVTIKEPAGGTPVASVPVGDVPDPVAGLPGWALARRRPRAPAVPVLRAIDTHSDPRLRAGLEQFACARVARRTLDLDEALTGEEGR